MIKSNELSTANIHINFPKGLGAKISNWPHSHPAALLLFTAAVVIMHELINNSFVLYYIRVFLA